jgi:sugar lactone lactonase YvrE
VGAVLAVCAVLFGATCPTLAAVEADWRVVTLAGTGVPGSAGDGGPGVAAQLDSPAGIVWDAAGGLYIADAREHRVRRLAPDGTITTIAGTGAIGFAGDGGPATAARLSCPRGLALGPAGELYIADQGNGRVRTVDSAGVISTFAGGGTGGLGGFGGDRGPAVAARFGAPEGLALSRAGELFVSDRTENRVRRVLPNGLVDTVAGNGLGSASPVVDGGPAVRAALAEPGGIAVDGVGNLLIADRGHHRVRRVDPAGTIGTFAGTDVPAAGPPPAAGDRGPAGSATLQLPQSLAIAPDGTVYIGDERAGRIRRVSPNGLIDTVAGGGGDRVGEGVPASGIAPTSPQGLAIRGDGALAYSDTLPGRVRLIAVPAPVVPPGPQAVEDRAATHPGQFVDVPVAANDTGDALSILSHTNAPHGLVVQLDDPTRSGANAVLRYTPGPGTTGTDSFMYTVSDRLGRQATGTVHVEVARADRPLGAVAPRPPKPGKADPRRGIEPPHTLEREPAEPPARPRSAGSALAGTGADGRHLLLTMAGSALLGLGVLALVAYRRLPNRRTG